MHFQQIIAQGVLQISQIQLMKIKSGNEPLFGRENAHHLKITQHDSKLLFNALPLDTPVVDTPLRIFEHLRLKLVITTISTGAMVKLGRIRSNYMIHLKSPNKKLIDRACRIVSELCDVSYEKACPTIFQMQSQNSPEQSADQMAIRHLEGEII